MRFLVTLLLVLVAAPIFAQDAPTRARMERQIAALQAEKIARNPAQQKLASALLRATRAARGEAVASAAPRLRRPVLKGVRGGVLVDLTAEVSDELLAEIARRGGVVESAFARDRAIRAELPLAQLEPLAERSDVDRIAPAAECATNIGSVTSEGDVAHRANLVRSSLGVDGTGVKVGVLSDSTKSVGQNHLRNAQALGDLPDVTVLDDINGSGEGTAMLEIVHDLAPGAQLFFATAFKGAASFGNNIRALAKAGCTVIIDDVTYFNESPFQDGVISRAVNEVSDRGVMFFSSARNSGNKNDATSGTWEGDFADGGAAPSDFGPDARFHAFSPGVIENVVTNNNSGRLDFFWADPLGQADNDYDLFVFDGGGNVVDFSNDVQNGNDDPYESIGQTFVGDRVVIVKFRGDARFLHLDSGRGRLSISTAGNVRGHNASGAANAFSVAASTAFNRTTPFNSSSVVETFSSDGPRRIFFRPDGTPITPGNFSSSGGQVLQKPDITAADGVDTTLPLGEGLNPFFGTSAAAPHAGAIVALMRAANPLATPAQLRAALQGTAIDIEAGGVDRDSGFGLIDALTAVQAVAPVPKADLVPATPPGWSAPMVISNGSGTTIDSSVLLSTDTLFLDLAVQNRGAVATGPGSQVQVFIDGSIFLTLAVPGISAGVITGGFDFNLGTLPAGIHTITARWDSSEVISELNELNNEFIKTIVVRGTGAPSADAASFTGLFQPAPNQAAEFGRFGAFALKRNAGGTFSAKLELGGRKYSLKGSIDSAGEAAFGRNNDPTATLVRPGDDPVVLDFSFGPLAAVDQIVGEATVNSNPHARLVAKRDAGAMPGGGRFTLLVAASAPGTPTSDFPQGIGFGSAVVSSKGKVKFKGKLPDGYGFSVGSAIATDESVAFHEVTKAGSGVLNGQVLSRAIPGQSEIDGSLMWVRLPTGKAPAYPAGWPAGISATIFGSSYVRMVGDPALPFLPPPDADGNALLTFAGSASFGAPTGAFLNIDDRDKDKTVFSSVAKLKFGVKAKTGAFGGSFKNPVTGAKAKFGGVVFDAQGLGAGFVLDGDETAAALLNPN